MTAIHTDGLTRRFGDVVAVDDLDLTVESGEVFGFLGPNGAGKSTTINMLLGFIAPSEGEARILGHDVTEGARAARRRIGLLPEGYDLYENLSGRRHVASAVETKGADDDPDELLARVGLDPEDAERAVGGYSKGMAQRLALAVALVGEPDLLVLDEPSSGLDPNGVRLLRDIVREEADRGATVFFSSHVLDEVEKVCDRVGVLDGGELVAVDAIDDLRADLGGEAVVRATVDRVPDLGPVEALDGVSEVETDGDAVSVSCRRPEAKMGALRRLDDAATVRDVEVEAASLETLFGELTAADEEAGGGAGQRREAAPAVAGGERA